MSVSELQLHALGDLLSSSDEALSALADGLVKVTTLPLLLQAMVEALEFYDLPHTLAEFNSRVPHQFPSRPRCSNCTRGASGSEMIYLSLLGQTTIQIEVRTLARAMVLCQRLLPLIEQLRLRGGLFFSA